MTLSNPEIDLTNKFTIDELNEIQKGLGTQIIKYLNLDTTPDEHYAKMTFFEKELEKLKLTTEDIFINKGHCKGKLLSDQFAHARDNLDTHLMLQDRLG
jgi:hypothetical protein